MAGNIDGSLTDISKTEVVLLQTSPFHEFASWILEGHRFMDYDKDKGGTLGLREVEAAVADWLLIDLPALRLKRAQAAAGMTGEVVAVALDAQSEVLATASRDQEVSLGGPWMRVPCVRILPAFVSNLHGPLPAHGKFRLVSP